MAVTVEEALAQLNIGAEIDVDQLGELGLYVDAANEWVATKVADVSPSPVKLATLMLISHLWETQRGPTTSPLLDGEIVTVSGVGFAIPNRVRELLDPYWTAKAAPLGSFPTAASWPDPVEWPT